LDKEKEEKEIPFCPECHSYPCSCDDNILDKKLFKMLEEDWPVHGI